ncbi:hypothetical protein PTI98_008781 [Pleurotus ostreatus]|nr:hypothetical protein PTI98_008781 [Pleurotus ostreatus]
MSRGPFVFGRDSLFDRPLPPTKPPEIVEVDAGVDTELMLKLMLTLTKYRIGNVGGLRVLVMDDTVRWRSWSHHLDEYRGTLSDQSSPWSHPLVPQFPLHNPEDARRSVVVQPPMVAPKLLLRQGVTDVDQY